MSGFSSLDEEAEFRGRIITAGTGRFRGPHGELFERDVVHHPGAVAVVPVTDAGEVLLVRQFRAPLGVETLEIPAGIRDVDGERPEATAHRELREEVGVTAGNMSLLSEILTTPGFCDERVVLFLATDLATAETAADGVEETHMTVERVALAEAVTLVEDGSLADAKTVVGLLLAREHLAR